MITRNPAGALLPAFITFTGADDATDPTDLVALGEDYPVEFGLLISPGRQGQDPRYPRLATIEWLIGELPLAFAIHLCGAAAREVIQDGISAQYDALMPYVDRVQINTADHRVQPHLVGHWAASRDVRAILQCRDGFPKIAAVDVLFDASGGRGIVPDDWPYAVKSTFCGYAGGLKPENVAAAIDLIGFRAQRYWIDMESGVRDEQNRFSVEKCREVCEAVYGAPIGGDRG